MAIPNKLKTNPLISILVPCYNVEKFVEQCITSICKQTYPHIEILCINDGSTDSTLTILQRCAGCDDRIRIITKPNSGYGHSMNVGLREAKGTYIGIVESDDFIEPFMFEKLITKAIKYDLDVSRGSYFEHSTKNGTDSVIDTSYVPHESVIRPIDNQAPFLLPPAIWSAIYKREFLNNNNIHFLETPGASYQDTSFAFKTHYCAERFLLIQEPLVHYRIDNPNSSVNNPEKVFCVCDEFNEIWRFARLDTERFERVKKLIPQLELSAYKWNFNRLSLSLRKSFLKKFRQDFIYLKNERLLDYNLIRKHDRKLLFLLFHIPSLLLLRSRI